MATKDFESWILGVATHEYVVDVATANFFGIELLDLPLLKRNLLLLIIKLLLLKRTLLLQKRNLLLKSVHKCLK